MNCKVKTFCITFAFCGLFASANAQINFLSNGIQFRSYENPNSTTTHYGDLSLSGGNLNNTWGWLYCNQIISYGDIATYGSANVSGNLNVSGSLNVYAQKNFIQPHPTDTTKVIRYVAIESGEALTLVRGTAKTHNGVIAINLPEHFGLVTSDEMPLTVLLTPENTPVLLYTTQKTRAQITVNMKQSDYIQYGDAEFAWQVTGVRDGYENQEVIVDLDSEGNIKETKAKTRKMIILTEKIKNITEKQKIAAKKKK